jgi:putative transposase
MPNHFHAIIGIGRNQYNSVDGIDINNTTGNKFGPQSKNLASIIRGFKSAVTINARIINPDFGWQSRYHDHIIRNQNSFQRIQSYIINNPIKWKIDTFYKK